MAKIPSFDNPGKHKSRIEAQAGVYTNVSEGQYQSDNYWDALVIAFGVGFVWDADVGKLVKMPQLVNVSGPILMNDKRVRNKQYTSRCSH